MATLGNTYLDLVELFKRSTPQAQIAAQIILTLARTNKILEDAMALECNAGMSHVTTVSTALPSVAWGRLYKGIPQSKGQTAQVTDTTGFAESLFGIDTRLLDLAGDRRQALRTSEAQMHLESMAQAVALKMIYGNDTVDPDEFMGLAPRFNDTSAANGGQIVDAQGSGSDNTSVWFVTWGDTASHLIYPEGTRAGIVQEEKGEQRVLDDENNPYYAMETLFRHHVGLTVRDPRTVARIANIDVSDLAAGSVDIYRFMRQAFWRLKRHDLMDGERMAIYCNSNVLEALDADTTPTATTDSVSASFVRLKPTEIEGRVVMTYRGIPVRQVDAISNTEAQVT